LSEEYIVGTKKITNPLNDEEWLEYEDWICEECSEGFFWVDFEDNVGGCIGICSETHDLNCL